MKVITLAKIKEYIESKHGRQEVTFSKIDGDESQTPGIAFIHNAGTKSPVAYLSTRGELCFHGGLAKTHCILLETDLEEYWSDHPFIKSREALNGTLVIDDKVPTEAELAPYFYSI